MTRRAALWASLVALAPASGLAQSIGTVAGRRVALVIGNRAYRNVPALDNPVNDAGAIARVLRDLGFELVGGQPLLDGSQRDLYSAIRLFGELLARSGADAVGVFYYAGHAVQVDGRNYLLPVEIAVRRRSDVTDGCVAADSILTSMSFKSEGLNVLIMDACRNNPFPGTSSFISPGLAEMGRSNHGSLIEYSTSPGETALDGDPGTNSPFCAALARTLPIPGLPVEQVFKRVRAAVFQQTDVRQRPWELTGFIGEFSFAPPGALGAVPLPVAPPPAGVALNPPLAGGRSPVGRPPASPGVERAIELSIQFVRNRVSEQSYATLDALAVALARRELAGSRFEINGYATGARDPSANLDLSARRASAVADYLESRGVPAGRLTVQGFGSGFPIDPAHPASPQNDRVEIVAKSA